MLYIGDVWQLVEHFQQVAKNFRIHTDRIDALAERVSGLETDAAGLELQVEDLAQRQWILAADVAQPKLQVGDRVGYAPSGWVKWQGVVIPRPYGASALSPASQQPLTFVLRDGDNAVRGCFAKRLMRL